MVTLSMSRTNIQTPGAPETPVKDQEIANKGKALLGALKAFIVPIIQSYLAERDTPVTTPTASINEDSDPEVPVLSALKTLVSHVIEGEIGRRDQGAVSEAKKTDVESEDSSISSATNAALVVPAAPTESEWHAAYEKAAKLHNKTSSFINTVADRILVDVRETVFNRCPIRLLWFDKAGSMQLIGRGDVYSILQSDLLHRLDNTTVDPYLHTLFRTAWKVRDNVEIYARHLLRYAILSHAWLQDSPGEITYKTWTEGSFVKDSAGYTKLASFCRVAGVNHGLQFGWMDSVCINKDSSSELDESIRSMYQWYFNSALCITYLANTTSLGSMHRDRWFKRGWTLQELVAPQIIIFYSTTWVRFTSGENDREDSFVLQQIKLGSSITPDELHSFHNRKPPISRRMQWAASRMVTREEDIAYSLMGLFDVSMSTAYGEGRQHAFGRLIKKIIANPGQDTIAMDIINCSHHKNTKTRKSVSSLLPQSPREFDYCPPPEQIWRDFEPSIPMMLTQRGLHVSALLVRGILSKKPQDIPAFSLWGVADPSGGYGNPSMYIPILPLSLLRRPFNSEGYTEGALYAILNHTVKDGSVFLGAQCLAVKGPPVTMRSSLELKIPQDGSTLHIPYELSRPVLLTLADSTTGSLLKSMPIADLEANGLYLRTLYM